MEDSFRLRIAVTPAEPLPDEGERITRLLDSGRFTDVHLRHPGATVREMLRLIESVAPRHHGRLHLHGHFDLINEFNLGGLHLNRRCPAPPPAWRGVLSASCHSLDDVGRCRAAGLDYVTVSPVFDSISKPGYRAAFTPRELHELAATEGLTVVALGGVTPRRLPELARLGFGAYAMLSAAWT